MSALAALWSLRSLLSQVSLQFLARFELPEDRAACLTGRVEHALQDVSAELSLRHRLDHIDGKLRSKERFEFHLLDFALQLLRALLGLLFQGFDLALHCGDCLFALGNFQPQLVLGFALGFVTNTAERFLNAGFDSQVELTPGIVEIALFADQLCLRLLGFGESALL